MHMDLLAVKFDSFDTESFVDGVLSYSKNSFILLIHLNGYISVYDAPDNNFYKNMKWRLPTNSKFVKLIFFWFIIIRILSSIFLRNSVDLAIIENPYAAVVVGFFRKIGKCKRTYYIPGDWLASKGKKSFLSFLFHNIFFPICDYISCKTNDIVYDHTCNITKGRYMYWGKKISNNQYKYDYSFTHLKACAPSVDLEKRKNLCFLGYLRDDSGIDMVIDVLTELQKYFRFDVKLKFVGPNNKNIQKIKNYASRENIEKLFDFSGFAELSEIPLRMADCFCGLNLITDPKLHSQYTVSGKVFHYLQNLVPPIVSNIGDDLTGIIRENDLGLIIKPERGAVMEAIVKVFNEQEKYVNNITEYIRKSPEDQDGFNKVFSLRGHK